HPTIVSLMVTDALAPSTCTSPTMSSSVMGRRISGSITRARAARTAASVIPGFALLAVELVEHGAQFGADEVLGRDILHREAKGHDLAREVLSVVEVALGALAVLLDLHAVTVVLAVLCKEDHGRRVARLQRQD